MINNSTDTYQVYMQSDSVPLIATPTLMFGDNSPQGSTFGFRNTTTTALAPNDLTTVNLGSASGGSVVQMDDIYVDTAGQNLSNPTAVPEPGAWASVVAGVGLLVGWRRRRALLS